MNITLIYIICITLFIAAIRLMAAPRIAAIGGICAVVGMAVAILTDFIPLPQDFIKLLPALILGCFIGIFSGYKIKITALPQMVAAFNGLGGGAAVCIAAGDISGFSPALLGGTIIGAVTFSGSLLAFCKLQGILSGQKRRIIMPLFLNMMLLGLIITTVIWDYYRPSGSAFTLLTVVSLLLGLIWVWPVGGADMPIIISVLNALSGIASLAIGFAQSNILLIVVGALIGVSGIILASFMIKSMNSSLIKIFQIPDNTPQNYGTHRSYRSGSPQDAAFVLQNALKVIIVPGFGMAAASAQNALKNLGDLLKNKYNVEVKYAVHPVAGRMPGHMNVLLAEAGINYEDIFGLDEINREFATADAAYVIGANDITNPEARSNPTSPLFGMPIFDVSAAKTVFFVKRSLGSGYSGADNPLFYAPNTIMLFGDAKKVTEEVDKVLEQ